jgi:CRISPR type III-B/RAMP module RAMP protein Cmr6
MIPMSPDVRRLVGDWADQVDNRSLLHEKFSLPKVWDVEDGGRLNDAGRWSVLRIVARGADLLRGDATRLRREAGGRNTQPHVRERKERDAAIADNMAKVAQLDRKLAQVANTNATRLLADLSRSYGGNVATFEATLGARLMVNLAGGVVENAGIALDRCFGLPLIPGSAVKGITRAQALWEIKEARPEDKPPLLRFAMLLFGFGAIDIKGKGDFAWAGGAAEAKSVSDKLGTTDFKGCACFLPAYPTTPPELVVDMVNPHYTEYYRGGRTKATDDESPIPNYFPAVKEGTTFGFAVLLNRCVPDVVGVTSSDLLQQARQWLERAVTQKGAGAKTAAGYGWFELGRKLPTSSAPTAGTSPQTVATAPTTAPASPADAFIAKWRGKLASTGNFPAALPELAAIASDAELKRAFEAVIPENERRRNRKSHPYWQSFTSGRHGETGKKILTRVGFNLS